MTERFTNPTGTGPLSGVKVLDLSSVIMGPYATQIFGDLGADVITVEVPQGDTNRHLGPGPHPELSGVALNLLRNKRNISLDLKNPEDRERCLQLAERSDVLVTNLRPGPLRRLKLTYDDVVSRRPDIVYCQAHGFPTGTPREDDPAYDDIIQSVSGIADLMERTTGVPRLAPTIFADKVCGLTVAYAVMAALFHRERTGQGQHLEVPMIDTFRSFLLVEHANGATALPQTIAPGYARILTPRRGPVRTADGWVAMLPYSKDNWVAILAAGGRAELMKDERMATARARIANSDFVYATLGEIATLRTTDEWIAFCEEHDIPATRVASLQDLMDDLPTADHPVTGPYRVIPPPVRFSKTPGTVRRPAPLIGEHTAEVLAELDAKG